MNNKQKQQTLVARQRKPRMVIPRLPNGLVPELDVEMKYVETFAAVVSSGVAYVKQYRLNSIFDPDFTSGGHQPYLRDTYAPLYGAYTVLSTRYRIQAYATNPTTVAVRPVNASAAPADMTLELERPYSKCLFCAPNQRDEVSDNVDIAKMLGIPRSQLLNFDNQTAQGSNPTNVVYLNIYGFGPDGTTTPTIFFKVEFMYRVRLTQLVVNQSQS